MVLTLRRAVAVSVNTVKAVAPIPILYAQQYRRIIATQPFRSLDLPDPSTFDAEDQFTETAYNQWSALQVMREQAFSDLWAPSQCLYAGTPGGVDHMSSAETYCHTSEIITRQSEGHPVVL